MSGRDGTTLVELLVALTLFAVVGTAVIQVLAVAEVELERAEVTLRATLLAREMAEGPVGEVERELPRGVLTGERLSGGPPLRLRLVYEPDAEVEDGAPGVLHFRLRPREWRIPPATDPGVVVGGGTGEGMPGGAP